MKRFFDGKNILILICLLFLIADMAFIFYNSAENAEESEERSAKIANTVAEIVVDGYEEMEEPEKTEVLNEVDGV